MAKIIWCTDLHLNFLNQAKLRKFSDSIFQLTSLNKDLAGIVVTGDISEATTIEEHLKFIAKDHSLPIYFVLGNHDYYKGSFAQVRKQVNDLCCFQPNLRFLTTENSFCRLSADIAIVGHDGWYDGLYSDWFARHVVEMADYNLISEFAEISNRFMLHEALKARAREGAKQVKTRAQEAIDKGMKKIVIATHVPPWRQNSVYKGEISDESWLPNFSSKIMGDAILSISEENPEVKFEVLCGHSHGDAEYSPNGSIRSRTGFSEYGRPWNSLKIIEL